MSYWKIILFKVALSNSFIGSSILTADWDLMSEGVCDLNERFDITDLCDCLCRDFIVN